MKSLIIIFITKRNGLDAYLEYDSLMILIKKRSVVIPYFNELLRFPLQSFIEEAKHSLQTTFILVDDGSKDGLTTLIRKSIQEHKISNIIIIEHLVNLGKASALKTGLKHSLVINSTEVGFLDADFSVSLHELYRLFDVLEFTSSDVVIGNRQPTNANIVQATYHRLVIGKLFSTFVRWYFKINLMDTQCGAKVFKVNDTLIQVLDQPVIDRWLYDLQMLIPIIKSGSTVTEVSLQKWINAPKSKFSLWSGLISLTSIHKIKKSLNHFGQLKL